MPPMMSATTTSRVAAGWPSMSPRPPMPGANSTPAIATRRLLATSDGLTVRHVRPGIDRLEWTALERTGAMRPVSAEICTKTGALSCQRPFAHWSDAPGERSHVIVVPDLVTFFAFRKAIGTESIFPFVVVAPVPGDLLPPDWLDRRYWTFERITILSDGLAAPAPLLPVLAGFGHQAATVTTPETGTWMSWASGLPRLNHDLLVRVATTTLPVSSFTRVPADDADRGDWLRRRCRSLDDQGRLCRIASVARIDPGNRAGTGREVLVRSDRTFAELGCVRLPSPAAIATASRWGAASVSTFVDGREPSPSVAIGHDLLDVFVGRLGFDESSAAIISAYVALTFVFAAFDDLPMLLIRGGEPATRFALRRLLAAVCCEPTVTCRARSIQLARIAHAGSGVVVLEEPGPLCGPSGATELGRFLESSLVRDASSYNAVSNRGGLCNFDTFGPRIVVAARAIAAGLACSVVSVELPEGGERSAFGVRTDLDGLRDRLHEWSMAAFTRLQAAAGGLPAERLLPAILQELFGLKASLSAPAATGVAMAEAGDLSSVPTAPSPAQLMEDVMTACATVGHLSMAQVMLEIALRGAGDPSLSPERIGRWIASHPRVDAGRPTERRRLHGQISRIYPLVTSAGEGGDPADAFRFCLESTCGECRYDKVCGFVFPEMRRRKNGP